MSKKKLLKNKLNILIIGLGNIGTRHLQSLLKLRNETNFYLVDPFFKKKQNRKIDKLLLISKNSISHKFFFYEEIDNLKNKNILLDLCIVATNSNKRFLILKKISSFLSIKNIILEKFLFNKLSQYSKALKLYQEKPNNIFVNQWLFQSSKLRQILKKYKNYNLDFKIQGVEWGMCCNIVHFIDLVRNFKVNDDQILKITKINLKPKIRPAKRKGFYETYGDLTLKYGNHSLFVKCIENNSNLDDKRSGINISIKAKNFKKKYINFNLKSNKIVGYENLDGKIKHFNEKIELMSELTVNIFNNLRKKRYIYLPTLKQSTKQHLIIFDVFSRHFENKINIKKDICPIT